MNDAPRQTLRELIARHGPGLCSDVRRCEGLLRDLCGEHRREINILVGALRERVPLDLLAGRNSAPTGLLLTRLAKRLEEHLALTEEASRWAVDSWALALGIISDAELNEMESRRVEASSRVEVSPRVEAATPPLARQSPAPPSTRPPAASKQTSAPPTSPRATRPTAQGSSTSAAPHHPAPPATRAPSAPQATNTGPLQTPSADADPRRRWRGCLVGCFLLILLAALLIVGGPLVLNILREEQQQQRSLEPQPVQTR